MFSIIAPDSTTATATLGFDVESASALDTFVSSESTGFDGGVVVSRIVGTVTDEERRVSSEDVVEEIIKLVVTFHVPSVSTVVISEWLFAVDSTESTVAGDVVEKIWSRSIFSFVVGTADDVVVNVVLVRVSELLLLLRFSSMTAVSPSGNSSPEEAGNSREGRETFATWFIILDNESANSLDRGLDECCIAESESLGLVDDVDSVSSGENLLESPVLVSNIADKCKGGVVVVDVNCGLVTSVWSLLVPNVDDSCIS